VLTAKDGRDALSLWNDDQLDLVILDVVMPVIGANELLPEIRRRCPDLKVLLTSGYSEAEAKRLCAAYGVTAFIQKPYTAKQVTQAVEELVKS
jgi:YesN/AraC family two-component response regulator